ncbi:MAG: hypothetical protein KC543_15530 [Myxococcales bacterium]|nr:hypothetical protein [Myxococcales bacterium]
MREAALVLGIVALLAAASGLLFVPWDGLLRVGVWTTAVGFATGVPLGVAYHVALYRALAPRGALPRGWYWSPIRLNARLAPEERGRVLFYCYAGAAGFVVICVGLLLAGIALINATLG